MSCSPFSSTTPVTRPLLVLTDSTRVLVRSSAPNVRADLAIAAETAPMPPSG